MSWLTEFVPGVVLAITSIAIFVGVTYSWLERKKELGCDNTGLVRRAAISMALFAVTFEVVLFAILWTPLTRSTLFLDLAALTDCLLLFVGLPCAFSWRGKAGWWIRVCALILLFFLYGISILVAGDL